MTLKEDASYAEHRFVVQLPHLLPEEQERKRGAHRQQQETGRQPAPEKRHLLLRVPVEQQPRQQADRQVMRHRQLQEEVRGRQATELQAPLMAGLLQPGSTEPLPHIPEELLRALLTVRVLHIQRLP